MVINNSFWKDKSVFLTGHTGFKGGWLAHWLSMLGARVHGFSLDPGSGPSFYNVTNLDNRMSSSTFGDIRDHDKITNAIKQSNADILFHMAAQPIVRLSYNDPLETFSTNVIGTANVLESARYSETIKAIVNITTDKCYENKERSKPYSEGDRLGGHDPYSASKACAEIVTSAFRRSYLQENNQFIASVRAGNVIGGGDWSADRLIPDFFKSIDSGEPLMIRSPNSIRPWQHVLEPLYGYLLIAENLFEKGESYAEAWNFGPKEEDSKPVRWIVEKLSELTSNSNWVIDQAEQPHEAIQLKLDSTKAIHKLNWFQQWDIENALNKTVEWHLSWKKNVDMEHITEAQINDYTLNI
jgi:CDP-glucose 4,6-dehydratase